MNNRLVGQLYKEGDRVYKKTASSSSTTFRNRPIYGHIIEVLTEKNSIGRSHYYYWIKHEGTGKRSKHIQHRLAAAPLTPQ